MIVLHISLLASYYTRSERIGEGPVVRVRVRAVITCTDGLRHAPPLGGCGILEGMAPVKSSSTTSRSLWSCLAALAVVLAVTVIVFAQTAHFTFVNWDDNVNVVQNPWLSDVGQFWRQPYDNLYVPVAYSFWALVYHLAGTPTSTQIPGFPGFFNLNPGIFHLATLLLHLANVTMVFVLLRRLVKNDLGAAAGSLLFAIHPLQVESVAWITETRGTLSTAFSLIAVLTYIRAWEPHPSPLLGKEGEPESGVGWTDRLTAAAYLTIATVSYVAALLCKPTVVVLPIIVLILDYFLLRRQVIKSLPVVAIWLAVAGVVTVKTQSAQPILPEVKVALPYHVLVAGHALGFYVAKLFVPINLGPDYGRTPHWLVQQPWAPATLVTIAAFAAAIGYCWKRQPVIAAGLSLFVAALLPVLGLVPFLYQRISTVADRYVYVAMLGPALIVAWLIARRPTPAVGVGAGIVLAVLAFLSFLQTGIWRDSYSLFHHSLAVNPRSYIAYDDLANALQNDGKHDEAIAAYIKSAEIKPDFADALSNLGIEYKDTNQPGKAIDVLKRALLSDPDDPSTHNTLAIAYAMTNQVELSRDEFAAAVRLQPKFTLAWPNLAYMDYKLGRYQDGVDAANKGIALDPSDANDHYCLAICLEKLGRADEAGVELDNARSINPDLIASRIASDAGAAAAPAPSNADPAAAAFANGVALDSQQNLDAAITAYRQALALKPKYSDALANLGMDYWKQHNMGEAARYLAEAVAVKPDAGYRLNLGVLDYMGGHLDEAKQQFRTCLKYNPQNEQALFNLGVVDSQTGDKAGAIASLKKAVQIKPDDANAQRRLAALVEGEQ
jgi:tetratricopeptide (TPR) repeat protein